MSNGEQMSQGDRLNQIAQEAREEISQRFGFSKHVFTVRGGDGIEQSGSRTGEWILHFWYKDGYGLDAGVIITEPDRSNYLSLKNHREARRRWDWMSSDTTKRRR